jgi:hypothetical protein
LLGCRGARGSCHACCCSCWRRSLRSAQTLCQPRERQPCSWLPAAAAGSAELTLLGPAQQGQRWMVSYSCRQAHIQAVPYPNPHSTWDSYARIMRQGTGIANAHKCRV